MDVEQHIVAAEKAEKDGMDGIWYGQIFGPDVMTVIAVAGPRTSRIPFGTSVVPTYLRHPVAMAQQALTTHAATGGRFNLGIARLTTSWWRTCGASPTSVPRCTCANT